VNLENVWETKEVLIDFNYIGKEQRCVLQILHNSPDSKVVELNGKIIGVTKIKKITYKDPSEIFVSPFRIFQSKK
jgi:hypothetical protein